MSVAFPCVPSRTHSKHSNIENCMNTPELTHTNTSLLRDILWSDDVHFVWGIHRLEKGKHPFTQPDILE